MRASTTSPLRAGVRRRRTRAARTGGVTWLATGRGPVAERRREVESIIRGCFRLLETYYRDGVVGDNEFPRETKSIRILTRASTT